MPFAITYRGEMSEPWYRHYLLVVCRWLLKDQGIAIDRVPRTRSDGRWLYVFDSQEDAERLAAKLREETEEDGWFVSATDGPPDVGPLRPLAVEMGRETHAVGFRLDWMIVLALRMHYPDAARHDGVWVKTHDERAFSQDGIRELAASLLPLLTGLSVAQLRRFSGFEVIDPVTETLVVPFTPFAGENGVAQPEGSPTHRETTTSLTHCTSGPSD